MNKRIFFMTIALTLLATSASAQVLLKNGRVHTVSGEPLEKASVLISADGKIEAVDPVIMSPPNYEVIDCEGKVITPGLIDVNARLGLVEIWAVDATRDTDPGFSDDLVRSAFRAADAFNPNSTVIPITRTGGVTSVVSAPDGGLVAGQAAWVDLGHEEFFGEIIEPYVSQHVAFGVAGSGATGGSRGGAMLKLRELYDDVKFFAANKQNFDQNRTRELNASRLDLLALETTLDGQLPVVFEANRASDILSIVEFSRSVGVRPIILGGAEAWMVAEQLAEAKVPVIVNAMLNLPYRFEMLGARADNASMLADAGVPVILSSFESHNVRNLRQYAGNAVRAGMAPDAALRAITLTPAEAFGLADRYGSLEAGKAANIVVWSGDPFEHSTEVERMYIQGALVSLDNRQRRLFEKYRTLDRRDELPEPRP